MLATTWTADERARQAAADPPRLRAVPRKIRRQRQGTAVQQRAHAQHHLQRHRLAAPDTHALHVAHLGRDQQGHHDGGGDPRAWGQQQRGRDRGHQRQRQQGPPAQPRGPRRLRLLRIEQQGSDLDVGMAQRTQGALQAIQAPGVGQQRRDALAPGDGVKLVHARAQAPVQHLASEDAYPGRQRLAVAVEQQVAPGLLVQRRRLIAAGEPVQPGDVILGEGIVPGLGFGRGDEPGEPAKYGKGHSAFHGRAGT
jgi:hypothetical protein